MNVFRAAVLAVAFVVVHAVLIAENLLAPNGPLGDVQFTYPSWWSLATSTAEYPGLTTTGVYPFLSLVPIAVGAQGLTWWFAMVTILNSVAVAILASRRLSAALAWLLFQLALGPIALGRIDAVTVALAVIAVALGDRSPRIAGVLVAVATWVKVWPIALGVAAIRTPHFASFARWSIGAAVVILGLGVVVGDLASVFSFLGQQQGRGLQVESVAATPWLWDAWIGGGSTIAFSPDIYTFEISGPGTEVAAGILTILQLVVLAAIGGLLVVHRRSTGGVNTTTFGYSLLAIIAVLITANKVGSPQFVSWIAVPLVALVLVEGSRISAPVVAVIGSIAVLTHLVYPYVYFAFLELRTVPLVLLTARNLLEVALVVIAVVALVRQLAVEKAAQQFADLGIGNQKGVVTER